MATQRIEKRRSSFEIIQGILSTCDNGGINKTAVMYQNSLSYNQLCRYLDLLIDREYLYLDERMYRVTPRGEVISDRIASLIREIGA